MINDVRNIRPITQYMWYILSEDVNISQIAAKFEPCLLNDDQKQKQLSVWKSLSERPKMQTQPFKHLPIPKDKNSVEGISTQG
jgi:hypothetical protein